MLNRLVLFGFLALTSISGFAQIDDVINKPKPKNADLFFAKEISNFLLTRIKSIEIGTLVDDMKRDGVEERHFYATLGVSGTLITSQEARLASNKNDEGGIIAFTIKASLDKKYYIHASLLAIGNKFEQAADSDEWNPIKSINAFTFVYDDGLGYRDIKSIGFNIAEVDLRLPLVLKERDRYIAFAVGGSIGGQSETIKSEDGTIRTYKGAYPSEYGRDHNDALVGLAYKMHAGLEIKETVFDDGAIAFKGITEFGQYYTGYGRVKPISVNHATNDNWDYIRHTRLYGKPEITLTKPLSRKTSLSLSVNGNIAIIDKLTSPGYEGMDPANAYETQDLKGRNRQPVGASLRLNF